MRDECDLVLDEKTGIQTCKKCGRGAITTVRFRWAGCAGKPPEGEPPKIYKVRTHATIRLENRPQSPAAAVPPVAPVVKPEPTPHELPPNVVLPPIWRSARTFLGALWTHVKTGAKQVTAEQYEARAKICDACPRRRGNKCTVCTCNLSVKMSWADQSCPEKKWLAIEKPSDQASGHST